jgi:hypothetical protein
METKLPGTQLIGGVSAPNLVKLPVIVTVKFTSAGLGV